MMEGREMVDGEEMVDSVREGEGEEGECARCKLSSLTQETLHRIFDGIVSRAYTQHFTSLPPSSYIPSTFPATLISSSPLNLLLFFLSPLSPPLLPSPLPSTGSRGDSGLSRSPGGSWRLWLWLLPT